MMRAEGAEVLKLAKSIRNFLELVSGLTWTVEQKPESWCAYLVSATPKAGNECRIMLEIDRHTGKANAVGVTSHFRFSNGQAYYGVKPSPKIGFSATKAPSFIALDIKRRLLEDTFAATDEAASYVAGRDAQASADQATLAELARIGGTKPFLGNRCRVGGVDFLVENGSIRLDHAYISPDVAKRFAAILAEVVS